MPSHQSSKRFPHQLPSRSPSNLPRKLWSAGHGRLRLSGWKQAVEAVGLHGLAFGWLLAVVAGLGLLAGYASRPGVQGKPAAVWPQGSGLPRSTGACSLVLLAHPKCPCTRASIDELTWIMSRCRQHLTCQVLLLQPDGLPGEWVRTDIWDSAAAIPGVHVQADEAGRVARIFGVQTSGHALLYDPAGRLLFEGGITPARGHRGDNLGRSRIVALVAGYSARTPPKLAASPGALPDVAVESHFVFGCPLFSVGSTSSPSVNISYRER